MASPQKERGFAPIANELLEALARHQTVGLSARILLWVARNTYGRRDVGSARNRKTCEYTWTRVADEIKGHRQHVSRAGNSLLSDGLLVKDRDGNIGLQKDYDQWAAGPKCHANGAHQKRDVSRTKTVTENVTGMVRLLGNKDNRQQTLTAGSERDLILESFTAFWTTYPKRRGYGPSLEAWRALAPSPELVAEILAAVKEQRGWEDWNRGDRWIPKPERWLAERRWLDKDETKARVVERKSCRRCHVAPEHSATWAYCKGCTFCSKCDRDTDAAKGTWHLVKGVIFCGECRAKEK